MIVKMALFYSKILALNPPSPLSTKLETLRGCAPRWLNSLWGYVKEGANSPQKKRC